MTSIKTHGGGFFHPSHASYQSIAGIDCHFLSHLVSSRGPSLARLSRTVSGVTLLGSQATSRRPCRYENERSRQASKVMENTERRSLCIAVMKSCSHPPFMIRPSPARGRDHHMRCLSPYNHLPISLIVTMRLHMRRTLRGQLRRRHIPVAHGHILRYDTRPQIVSPSKRQVMHLRSCHGHVILVQGCRGRRVKQCVDVAYRLVRTRSLLQVDTR